VPRSENGEGRSVAPGLSSPDIVVQDVVRGLYEGRYVPGQRLIEADLTRRYGVGRGTVREALNRLAAEGVVALTLHRGAYIRALDRAQAAEIVAILEVLIGLAARLAAERIGAPGAADRLRQALERLMRFDPHSASPDFARARDAFYGALTEIGGNRELARVLPSIQAHIVRVQFRPYAGAIDAVRHDDYRAIAEAVLAGDPERAEAAGRLHMRRSADLIAALPDRAFAFGP
jgi:DNA-binding GntR family transcriptional regulator